MVVIPFRLNEFTLLFVPLEQQGRIRPAEAEAVRERVTHGGTSRLIGDVIEVAFGIGIF